jgi:hypothetical protein
MSSTIAKKILERIGYPDLLRTLVEELRGTELNSLLLEVFSHRASLLAPSQLLNHYQHNRFVKPADLPVIELKRIELDVLEIFSRFCFEPLELSPVTVFGSCSAVATADQRKILSALRGTEVLADATNAIALHICDVKQRMIHSDQSGRMLRFGVIQRHLRTQQIEGKGFTPHFKIGCLVTAGRDTGSFAFEKQSLCEHIALMKHIYLSYYKVEDICFRFLCRSGGYSNPQDLAYQVKEHILHEQPDVQIAIEDQPEKENGYYKGIQYKIDIRVNGQTYEIGDGGFVDWTQQLLQNRKERMLSTGIGFEFMYRIMNGLL